jgi:hypothetical protein
MNPEKNLSQDQILRQQLLALLKGGEAHANFSDVMKNFPPKLRGVKPDQLAHSGWMLLEHMRLGQRDILDFSTNSKYKPMKWPDDYWPKNPAPPTSAAWNKSIQQFRKDLAAIQALVANRKTDLFAPIAWGEGQTILREALLVADHNAYHLGQMLDLRRILCAWKG